MDLILWRHAEAEDQREGGSDLERALTGRGRRQAAQMAAWLEPRLPRGTRILSSPAVRCEQTVLALGHAYEVLQQLQPGARPQDLLQAAGWPSAERAVLIAGHQPVLGQTIAQLLGMEAGECTVRKAGVWWLRSRDRAGDEGVVVRAVQTPDLLDEKS